MTLGQTMSARRDLDDGVGACVRAAAAWTTRWTGALAATVLGSGMAFLDGTIVNVAAKHIGTDFHSGFAALQWVLNAYTLTLAALILLGGSLGDRLGRRRVFLVGVIWFAAASLACAVAPNVGVLIAARAVQGIGGALMTPGSLAIISSVFAPEDPAQQRSAPGPGWPGVSTAPRPTAGWLARPVVLVAVGVRHQPAARRGGRGDRTPLRARDQGGERPPAPGRPRHGAHRPRPRRSSPSARPSPARTAGSRRRVVVHHRRRAAGHRVRPWPSSTSACRSFPHPPVPRPDVQRDEPDDPVAPTPPSARCSSC